MSIQTLAPPMDITWTRMAFARDMIDTKFGDLAFGPKWRSSLAVYYYIVPDEETADSYPELENRLPEVHVEHYRLQPQ